MEDGAVVRFGDIGGLLYCRVALATSKSVSGLHSSKTTKKRVKRLRIGALKATFVGLECLGSIVATDRRWDWQMRKWRPVHSTSLECRPW